MWLTNRAQDNVVRDNRFAANSKNGIWVERASGTRMDSNEIISTGGDGIALEGADSNVVSNSYLEDNSGGGILVGLTTSGVPGNVGLPSNNNVIESNNLIESGGDAIEVEGTSITLISGTQLIDNIAFDSNGDGISLNYARDALIKDNDVSANKGGIGLKNTTHSRIEGNTANESDGDGIGTESLSLNNEIVGNESSHNLGDGIYVGDESSGSSGLLIEGNRTIDNKGYGIFVPKVSHIIKGNTANDNDSWGIWVSEGSNGRVNIDGGGNKAQGNVGATDPITLKPLQCYGIQCEYGAPLGTDQIPPETLIIEAPGIEDPNNQTTNPVATFRFTGTDNASTVEYQCRLDAPVGSTDGLDVVHEPEDLRRHVGPAPAGRARLRLAHARGPRARRGRQHRRDAGEVHLVPHPARERRPAGDDHRLRAERGHRRDGRDLRVLRPTSTARPSSAGSTGPARPTRRSGRPARRRRRTPGSPPSASTSSRSARRTSRTSTTCRRPSTRGRSPRRPSRARSRAARSSCRASSSRTTSSTASATA